MVTLTRTRKILFALALFFVLTKVVIVIALFAYPKLYNDISLSATAQELINMTNEYRQDNNLLSLRINPRLTQAAVNKARDIITNQHFDHSSVDGQRFSQWIKDVDYQYLYVGENLAIDFDNNQDLFAAWLESTSHKDNIEKPQYQEIGVAALEGKFKNHSTIVVVQLFGSRVLSADSTTTANTSAPDLINNYFYPKSLWEKLTSLKSLEELNQINTYLLLTLFTLIIITYKPYRKRSHRNMKAAITRR
jgi:hypothetical protein